nr:hypothetical protein CFP56_60746 [Quercus suber]
MQKLRTDIPSKTYEGQYTSRRTSPRTVEKCAELRGGVSCGGRSLENSYRILPASLPHRSKDDLQLLLTSQRRHPTMDDQTLLAILSAIATGLGGLLCAYSFFKAHSLNTDRRLEQLHSQCHACDIPPHDYAPLLQEQIQRFATTPQLLASSGRLQISKGLISEDSQAPSNDVRHGSKVAVFQRTGPSGHFYASPWMYHSGTNPSIASGKLEPNPPAAGVGGYKAHCSSSAMMLGPSASRELLFDNSTTTVRRNSGGRTRSRTSLPSSGEWSVVYKHAMLSNLPLCQ